MTNFVLKNAQLTDGTSVDIEIKDGLVSGLGDFFAHRQLVLRFRQTGLDVRQLLGGLIKVLCGRDFHGDLSHHRICTIALNNSVEICMALAAAW